MGGHSGITLFFSFCINGVVFGKHRKKGNENRRRGKNNTTKELETARQSIPHHKGNRCGKIERHNGAPVQDEESEKDIYGLKYEAGLDDTGKNHHGRGISGRYLLCFIYQRAGTGTRKARLCPWDREITHALYLT